MSRNSLTSMFIAGILAVSLVACNEPDDSDEGETTNCGSINCIPGQYCLDPLVSLCENGCLTDDNCADNQFCEMGFYDHGQCVNREEPVDPVDQLERCQDACSTMVSCDLLTAPDGSACQSQCASADDNTRRSIADCVESWDCAPPLPGCLGIECGGVFECPGADQMCVDGSCL